MSAAEDRVDRLEQHMVAVMRRLTALEAHSAGSASPAGRLWDTAPPPPQPDMGWAASAQPRGRRFDVDLTPSRVLALAGGLVLLLGIGFLLRYAVAQGWLGPAVRVVLALTGSTAFAALGLRLERSGTTRVVGQVCTATGATGVYSAFVAASVGYELVPALVGLGGAVVIAIAATARGVWARNQAVAALGAGGALLAPALTQAVAGPAMLLLLIVATAATVLMAVRHSWPALSLLAFVLVLPQGALANDRSIAGALALLGVVGLIFLAAAIAHGRGEAPARTIGVVLAALNAVAVTAAGWALWIGIPDVPTSSHGRWAAGVSAAYLIGGLAASACRPSEVVPRVTALCGVLLANLAAVLLLDGYAVSGVIVGGALAAAAAARVPQLRGAAAMAVPAQLAAVAVHAMSSLLWRPDQGSAEAVLMVAGLAAAAVVAALLSRPLGSAVTAWAGVAFLALSVVRLVSVEAPPSALLEGTTQLGAAVLMSLVITAGGLGLGALVHRRFLHAGVFVANYGLSLAAVAMDPDGVGRVALTGLWAVTGAIALGAGRHLARADVRRAGAALLTSAVSKAALIDTTTLEGTNRAAALLLCGAVLVATAIAEARAATAPSPAHR